MRATQVKYTFHPHNRRHLTQTSLLASYYTNNFSFLSSADATPAPPIHPSNLLVSQPCRALLLKTSPNFPLQQPEFKTHQVQGTSTYKHHIASQRSLLTLPRTHRALRRLQSAHTLGQSNNSQPSLITQQHKQALQRTQSPANNTSAHQHHSRGRSNSDATNMIPPNLGAAGRRPVSNKRPIAADALSLDKLIREGPPDGDLVGALESTRLKILGQGIKSDSDGMVSILLPNWKYNIDKHSPPCESTSGLSSLTPPS